MSGDNINKTAQTEKHEAPSKSNSETNADAWGAKSEVKIAANQGTAKSEEHGFLNMGDPFKGVGDAINKMGDVLNQTVHGASEMMSNFGKQSPEQIEAQRKAQQEKEAEEARKHAPESPADAAKHGGLVWSTNAEGQQEPQPPGDVNPLFGGKVDGPMEAVAWARYNQAISSKGFYHASKDDTLDGKRVEQ